MLYNEGMRTNRQGQATRKKMIEFIKLHQATFHYSPSMREIAAGVSVSLNAIHYHLLRMEQDGLIERDAGIARSIRIVQ